MKKIFPKRTKTIRKKVSQIPKGQYCYTLLNDEFKICPFWENIKGGAKCKLLKLKSKKYDPFNLIWDQCKECSYNY